MYSNHFPCDLPYAEEDNHCHDKETNLRWELLAKNNPDDDGMISLHALRIGLCIKIEMGDITVDKASKILESARQELIKKHNKLKHNLEKDQKIEL